MKKTYCIFLLVLALCMMPSCSFKPDEYIGISLDFSPPYEKIVAEKDILVCGNYVKQKRHIKYSEYIFDITEVIKGDVTEKQISVISENIKGKFKSSLDDKIERTFLVGYEKKEEYFLMLSKVENGDYVFISTTIVPLNNLEKSKLGSESFITRFESEKMNKNTTRDEFVEYMKEIVELYSEKEAE